MSPLSIRPWVPFARFHSKPWLAQLFRVTLVNKVNYSFCLHVVCHAEKILRGMYLMEFMNFFLKGDTGYSIFGWRSDKKRRWIDKLSTSFWRKDQFSISAEVELQEAQERGQSKIEILETDLLIESRNCGHQLLLMRDYLLLRAKIPTWNRIHKKGSLIFLSWQADAASIYFVKQLLCCWIICDTYQPMT